MSSSLLSALLAAWLASTGIPALSEESRQPHGESREDSQPVNGTIDMCLGVMDKVLRTDASIRIAELRRDANMQAGNAIRAREWSQFLEAREKEFDLQMARYVLAIRSLHHSNFVDLYAMIERFNRNHSQMNPAKLERFNLILSHYIQYPERRLTSVSQWKKEILKLNSEK